jgi:hypothetical protein
MFVAYDCSLGDDVDSRKGRECTLDKKLFKFVDFGHISCVFEQLDASFPVSTSGSRIR